MQYYETLVMKEIAATDFDGLDALPASTSRVLLSAAVHSKAYTYASESDLEEGTIVVVPWGRGNIPKLARVLQEASDETMAPLIKHNVTIKEIVRFMTTPANESD